MSKICIIEWDMLSFSNLFYSIEGLNCFFKLDDWSALAQGTKLIDWKDCRDFPMDAQFDNTGSPPSCFNHIISPTTVIIDIGECYDELLYSIYFRWIATFIDNYGIPVDWAYGRVNLPLSPLQNLDCIKYILNINNVLLGTTGFSIPTPDPHIDCSEYCDCCNCCN